jgi:predicted nucleic acid-binding protein
VFAGAKRSGCAVTIYAHVIRDSANLVVPMICIYQVLKRVLQQRDEEEALKAVGLMTTGRVMYLTQEIALNAALLSIEPNLLKADSNILATARLHNAILWMQDEHFMGLIGVEDMK